MIDLYTWTTPNGRKASVMLEEVAAEYKVHSVNIGSGDQFEPGFVAIAPNSKIPAIVDDGITLFESGAILIHLAEKFGVLLPTEASARATTLQWLMWQMAGIGPILGQTNHFLNAAPEQIPYAINRFVEESVRLIKVMDDRLNQAEYLGGSEYSIADIATYPWLAVGYPALRQAAADALGDCTATERWLAAIAARPAVQRGMAIPEV